MTAVFPAVSGVIPHAGRLILLDQIVEFSTDAITCLATVRSDNPYLSESGVLGEWIALEYMSQAIAAHSGLEALERNESPRVGFLLGTRKFRSSLRGGLQLGQIVRVRAQRVWQEGGMAICEASIVDGLDGATLMEATLSVYLPESESLLEEMKRE